MLAGDACADNIMKLVKNRKKTLIICHRLSLPLVVFVCDLKPFGGNYNNNFKNSAKSMLNKQFINQTPPTVRHAALKKTCSICLWNPHFSKA